MRANRDTNLDQTSPMDYARLNEEVRRLLDFKRANVKGRNRTPCPECATVVDVNANKCPQCASEIAEHTENVRQHLAELEEIKTELDQLHVRFMEYREEEASMQPMLERCRRMFSGPQMATGLKTVLPAFLVFFAFLTVLRLSGNGLLFWVGLAGGGVVAYSLLKMSSYKHYVTVELYRGILVVGAIVMMTGSVAIPMPDWSGLTRDRVEVIRPTANIRASASTESSVVSTASQGEKLTVVERQGSWIQVKTESGDTGWIYASLVK